MTAVRLPARLPIVGGVVRGVRSNRLIANFIAGGRWRRTLPAALGVVVALLAYDSVLVEFMHTRRQDALVSEFNAQATSADVAFGDAVALLQIPSIGVNTVVGEGESHASLRAGPAHRLTSAFPGSTGNAVISGKSMRYGAPFAKLDQLKEGAEVYVKTRAGAPVRYIVESVSAVSGGDAEALRPSDEGRLTLLTSASRFGGDVVTVQAVAAAGSVLEQAGAVPSVGALEDDDVSVSDLAVVATWLAALVVLVLLARRMPEGFVGAARWVVMVPVAALAALQLLLAIERFLPATV